MGIIALLHTFNFCLAVARVFIRVRALARVFLRGLLSFKQVDSSINVIR